MPARAAMRKRRIDFALLVVEFDVRETVLNLKSSVLSIWQANQSGLLW